MKRFPLIFILLATTAVAVLLQLGEEYEFFFREQTLLFDSSLSGIASGLFQVGGLSAVLSGLITQFFIFKYAGALITGVLAGLGAWNLWKATKAPGWLLPLCFLPFLSECICLADQFYSYQGFISFLLLVLALRWYLPFSEGRPLRARVLAGTILTLALFVLAGPVATLLALCIFVWTLLTDIRHWYAGLVPAAALAVLGLAFFLSGITDNFSRTFFAAGYFDELVYPRFFINLSWFLLPAVLVVAALFRKIEARSIIPSAALTLLAAAFVFFGFRAVNDPLQYQLLKELHFAARGNWEAIYDDPAGKDPNYLFINLRNLAKSHLDLLPDRLFDSPQNGAKSILAASTGNNQNPDMASIMAWVYMRMGDVAAAQNAAFDAMVGYKWGSPYMARILVQTNLVLGSPAIAEKYICALEKTLFHSRWAREQRRFLCDDAAIEADQLLSRYRSCVPSEDHLLASPGSDLRFILEAAPADSAALGYYRSLLLLEGNLEEIKNYIEATYAPGDAIPQRLGEAYLVYFRSKNRTPDFGLISQEVAERYDAFIARFNELAKKGLDPVQAIRGQYGDTFWYYMISVQR